MDSSESVEFLHPDLKTRQAGYAMVGHAERGEHRCVVGLKKQVTGSPKDPIKRLPVVLEICMPDASTTLVVRSEVLREAGWGSSPNHRRA
jgi:hypothetical protein